MSEREKVRADNPGDKLSRALSEVDDLVPVVCSECGVSYMAGASADEESLICPQCGPSIPIDESPRRRRRIFRLPKPRMSLGVLQFLVLGLTFAVFLGIVMSTLDAKFGRKDPMSGDAIVQRMLGKTPPPKRGPRNRKSAKTPADTTEATRSDDAQASGDTSDADDGAKSDESQSTSDQVIADLNDAPSSPTKSGDLAIADEIAMIAVPSIPTGNVTIRYVMEHADRLLGRRVTILCRLVTLQDDARDRVPNRFEVDGRSIRLSSEDELSYRRLEISDVEGRRFQNMYVKNEGVLAEQFAWLQGGDWVVLTATPGKRIRALGRFDWGMIVTDVSPAAPVVQTPTADAPSQRRFVQRDRHAAKAIARVLQPTSAVAFAGRTASFIAAIAKSIGITQEN